MMTLDEMKLAVCEKLPELFVLRQSPIQSQGKHYAWTYNGHFIYWPTEGLQVCHEAEKLLDDMQAIVYAIELGRVIDSGWRIHVTYEQRLEALCRVWYPERF